MLDDEVDVRHGDRILPAADGASEAEGLQYA